MEDVAKKHGCTISYRPLDIMGLFSRTGGTAPKDRHVSRQEYRLTEMRRAGIKNGMDINLKPAHWPTNPAPSSYAIIAAQKAGGGDMGALAHGFLRACWAEQRDISQDDVVRDVLSAAGFDPKLADADLVSSADEYTANLEQAINVGVYGAPFYIVGEERFWGQDRVEDLDMHLAGKL